MMKIKNILPMMAAMGLLGACAEADEQQKAQVGEAVTIQLTANVASETLTMGNPSAWTRDAWDAYQSRALTRGIQETTLINGQKVYLWADKGTAGTYAFLQAWNLTSDGSGGLSGTTKYYPTDGDGLTFRAVHGNFSVSAGTAIGSVSHTVETNQSTAGNYEKSDLMYGEGSGSWESAGTVDFVHKLSKIEVNLTPGIGLLPSDMTSATVQIHGVKPTVSINAQTGDLGSASGTAVTITARHTGNGTFEAVIPPQTAPSGMLTVTIGDVTATIPNAVATFASNAKYVYNVKCTNKDKHLNPLWYVAENNVKSYNSSTKVVTLETSPTATGSSYCYSWVDAMANFGYQRSSYDTYWIGDITDGTTGFKYHLPVLKEWFSVLPSTLNVFNNSSYQPSGGLVSSAAACVFGYSDDTKTGVDDWSYWSTYTTANVRYALRYLGTPYCSAWKYEFNGSVLTITAKLIDYLDKDDATLGTKLSTYMNDASFWTSLNEEEGAMKRQFYAVGYRYNSNNGGTGTADGSLGTFGHYWSATETSADNAPNLDFNNGYLYLYGITKKWGFSVRLFRNEGPAEARATRLTPNDIGKVLGANGKVYSSASAATSDGTTASGIIAYVGSSVDVSNPSYNSLIRAMTTVNNMAQSAWYTYASGTCVTQVSNEEQALTYLNGIDCTNTLANSNGTGVTSNCVGHTHTPAQRAKNFSTARPSGASQWFLASVGQWKLIAQGLASKTASPTNYGASNLNTVISPTGGETFWLNGYWTCTEYSTGEAWGWTAYNVGGAYHVAKIGNSQYPVFPVFAY